MTVVLSFAKKKSDDQVRAQGASTVTEAQLRRLRSVMWLGNGAVSANLMLETLQELETALTYALCGGRGVRPNDPATEHLGMVFLELSAAHQKALIHDASLCVKQLREHVLDASEPLILLPATAHETFSALYFVSLDALFRLYWEHMAVERVEKSA